MSVVCYWFAVISVIIPLVSCVFIFLSVMGLWLSDSHSLTFIFLRFWCFLICAYNKHNKHGWYGYNKLLIH